MRKLIGIALGATMLAGCGSSMTFGQVPPTTADIVWTWSAPSGCTVSAPCSYYISVLAVPNGTASCPASTGTSYSPLGAGPINGLTITDTGETLGTTVCAIAQTLQNGLVSRWSTPSAPVVMPSSAPVPNAPSGAEKSAFLVFPITTDVNGPKELSQTKVWPSSISGGVVNGTTLNLVPSGRKEISFYPAPMTNQNMALNGRVVWDR